MARPTEIMVERQSANDAEATVVEIDCASGTAVKRDQRIFAIETSKAVEEICAPIDGILVHRLTKGEIVPFGVAIAEIRDAPGGSEPAPADRGNGADRAAVAPTPAAGQRQPPRLSRAAAALAAQHGIAATAFASDFVTAAQVRRHLGSAAPAPTTPAAELEPVAARKREEIRALSQGAGASMLSIVGAELGAVGLERSDLGPMFATRIVDVVVYEAARLMRRFGKLNAAWHDGGIEYHDAVNAGIAYDDGGRLVVYGIAKADELSLDDIQDAILDGFRKYVTNRLTAQELTRATFTVTDLSPTQTDFVFPLLPRGQSCIIGIAGSPARGFRLYLGFDHRVTEGLEAARFLQQLREAIGAALAAHGMVHPRCGLCGREPAPQAGPTGHLLRIVDRIGADMLCCHACWSGGSQIAPCPPADEPMRPA
jgi:pyruvate/2-oxoglutarate dehydrogenase complex dihydrolipoamide acyltransferase (E2) component